MFGTHLCCSFTFHWNCTRIFSIINCLKCNYFILHAKSLKYMHSSSIFIFHFKRKIKESHEFFYSLIRKNDEYLLMHCIGSTSNFNMTRRAQRIQTGQCTQIMTLMRYTNWMKNRKIPKKKNNNNRQRQAEPTTNNT